MRSVIWFLLLFVLAVTITLLARFDAGYVVVVLPPWRLEMSFMLAAVALVLLYLVSNFLVRMVRMALSMPRDVRAWRQRRRSDKAEDNTSRAVAAYLSGRTEQARKLALDAIEHEHLPIAVLVAAHAAIAEGHHAQAENLLKGLQTDVNELVEARKAAWAKLASGAGAGE